MTTAILLTITQLCWAFSWARLHLRIRRSRAYSLGRARVNINTTYERISPLLYVGQNLVSILCFWSDAPTLLKFHDSTALQWVGVAILLSSTALYILSVRFLGRSYSPCYDSHLPLELVSEGPYRFIRHPMFLAKMLIGVATILMSGSLWFVVPTVYLMIATIRAMRNEEIQLASLLNGYQAYQTKTSMLIPRLY